MDGNSESMPEKKADSHHEREVVIEDSVIEALHDMLHRTPDIDPQTYHEKHQRNLHHTVFKKRLDAVSNERAIEERRKCNKDLRKKYFSFFRELTMKLTIIIIILFGIFSIISWDNLFHLAAFSWILIITFNGFLWIVMYFIEADWILFPPKKTEGLIYQTRPPYVIRSLIILPLVLVFILILSGIHPTIIVLLHDNAELTTIIFGIFFTILYGFVFVIGFIGLISITNGRKYESGIVSAYKPFSCLFTVKPYFIPFSDVEKIGALQGDMHEAPSGLFFWMKDGTIAPVNYPIEPISETHYSKILHQALKTKCPKAETRVFSDMGELRAYVTGNPKGTLPMYRSRGL